jgi:hypothetical protein
MIIECGAVGGIIIGRGNKCSDKISPTATFFTINPI